MEKFLAGITLILVLFWGCASQPQAAQKPMASEYWKFTEHFDFFPENLLSITPQIKQKALDDFKNMDATSKQRVLTYLAYTLGDEQDPEVRRRTYNILRELKAGEFIVTPLILAYGNNSSEIARLEIKRFIMEYNPSKFDLQALRDLLHNTKWETKLMAMKALSMMKQKADVALPDITDGMCQAGPSYGVYAECYDFAEMINKDATVASVALDLKNQSDRIRESALRKLNDILRDTGGKTKSGKIAFQAIVRTMYSNDGELSSIAREMLQASSLPEAAKAIKDFDNIMNIKTPGMKQEALKDKKIEFENEETSLYLMLKAYYEKIGREDAVKKINE